MNAVALAIVFAAILWALERNKAWPHVWRGTRRGAKVLLQIVAILFVGSLVVWGILAAVKSHQDEVARKAREKVAADRAQLLTKLQADVCPADSTIAPLVSTDPNAWPSTIVACIRKNNTIAGLTPEACAKVEAAIPEYGCKPKDIDLSAGLTLPHKPDIFDKLPAQKHETKLRAVNVYIDVGLTTTEHGNIKCATLRTGDIVTLVSSDDSWYPPLVKVRTADGIEGWTGQNVFEVVH